MSHHGKGGRGNGKPMSGLLSSFMQHLAAEVLKMGGSTSNKRQRKQKKPGQCFRCQKLGHMAIVCKETFVCLKCAEAHDTRKCKKPQDAAKKCANCGGPHAANFRQCSYISGWGCEKKKERTTKKTTSKVNVEQEGTAATPPSHAREGSGPVCSAEKTDPDMRTMRDQLRRATNDAVLALKAAMAEERAALCAELDAARRQVEELAHELRAAKEEAAALATSPTRGRELGVEASTQTGEEEDVSACTSVASTESQMEEEVPIEMDASPSEEEAAPKVHKERMEATNGVANGAGDPEEDVLPLPDKHSITEVLKKIAASIKDKSYPHFSNPYPFVPSKSKPPLPHRPFDINCHRGILQDIITKKEIRILNAHPVFTEENWWHLLNVAIARIGEEYRTGKRKLTEEDLAAQEYFNNLGKNCR